MRRLRLLASSAVLAAASCGSGSGDPAVWAVDPADPPTESSESFTALVMRVGCAGGRTGEVLEPTVDIGDDEIIIVFTVAAISGDQECPGNDVARVVVEVGEPIGDRPLVDGTCRAGVAPAGLCGPDTFSDR
ncbi:MAG: hypothetical protein AAGC53_15885 [Actinomycetota bacterium]